MKIFLKEKGHLVLGIVVLIIYLSPNIFFPDDARILVHDNLDSNVVWYKNIVGSDVLFGDNEDLVKSTLNGLERGVFISEYSFIVFLYYIFDTLTAYHLNIIIQCLVAFFGMYLFSRKYVYKEDSYNYINVLIALSFACLPFWPSGGIGVAGIPLLMFNLLNVFYKKDTKLDWFCLFFYPLYSSLFLSGLFVVTLVFLYFLMKMLIEKTMNIKIIVAFLLVTLMYVFVENRMFSFVLIDGYETSRNLTTEARFQNYKGIIGNGLRVFLTGQYHFHSMQYPFIISFLVISFLVLKKSRWFILKVLGVLYFLSVASIIFYWDQLRFLQDIDIVSNLQFRWIAFSPFLWFWLLAIVSKEWVNYNKKFIRLMYLVLVVSLSFVIFSIGDKDFYGSEYAENSFYKTYFDRKNEESQTFSEFYEYEVFSEIKKIIPQKTKVACLGVLPEIAQFHGYCTLGGYYSLYSKKHHDLIFSVLGKEKEKLNLNKLGNRCYLNCLDLKENKAIIDNLELNFDLLKEKGYHYIFLDRLIVGNKSLKLLNSIKSNILIYEIIDVKHTRSTEQEF